jgi:hypothetical protein
MMIGNSHDGVTPVVNENGTEILVVDPASLSEFIERVTADAEPCPVKHPEHGSACICYAHATGEHRDEHGCTWPNLGLCTRDASHGTAEVPWSRERLCWNCADAELDRLAKATELEPVQIGGFGLGVTR